MLELIYDIFEAIFYFFFKGLKRKKQKKKEWKGVIIEKKIKGTSVLSKYNGLMIFRTEEDKEIKLTVSEKDLDKYELNKRYHKKSGEVFPVLVE